jgi:hypothetical protein
MKDVHRWIDTYIHTYSYYRLKQTHNSAQALSHYVTVISGPAATSGVVAVVELSRKFTPVAGWAACWTHSCLFPVLELMVTLVSSLIILSFKFGVFFAPWDEKDWKCHWPCSYQYPCLDIQTTVGVLDNRGGIGGIAGRIPINAWQSWLWLLFV